MQPALNIANSVAQVMLAPPFTWNWNRSAVNFLAVSGCQEYKNAAGWVAAHAYTAGQVIIDSNGNAQKVLTGGTSGGSAPSWSTSIFASTTDNGIVWQNGGPLTSIQQATDFGFIEKAQVQDINGGNVWKEIQVKLDLSRDTATSCPKYVSAQTDDNAGDISFRLMPVPGVAYPVSIQYQKKQPLFTGLTSSWAPIPDHLFYTYSWGFLALAYLYAEDPRFGAANQKFIGSLLANSQGLTETQINIFAANWNSITNTPAFNGMRLSQGIQASGL